MPAKKPKSPDDILEKMSRKKLHNIVKQIAEILYFDCDTDTWDPNKEFEQETIEMVQQVIDDNGLRPPDPESDEPDADA